MPAHPKYHHFLQKIEPDQLYAAITIVSLAESNGALDQWAAQQDLDRATARKRLQGALNTFRTRNISDAADGKLHVHNREIAAWYGARWRLAAECDDVQTRERLQATLGAQDSEAKTSKTSQEPRKRVNKAEKKQQRRRKSRFSHFPSTLVLLFLILGPASSFLTSYKKVDSSTEIHEVTFTSMDQFDLAWNEYLLGNYVEASRLLYKILRTTQNGHLYASCHYLLGIIKLDDSRFSSSITNFQKAEKQYSQVGNFEDLIKTQVLKTKAFQGLSDIENLTILSRRIDSNISKYAKLDSKNENAFFAVQGMWNWTKAEIALENGRITDFKKLSDNALQNFKMAQHELATFKAQSIIIFYYIHTEKQPPKQWKDQINAVHIFSNNSNSISPDYKKLAEYLHSLLSENPISLDELKDSSEFFPNEVLKYLLKTQTRSDI